MTSQAFMKFEVSTQVIEAKVAQFMSTSEKMIRQQHYDSRRIRHEVEGVQTKWDLFLGRVKEYRDALDASRKFFEMMDGVSVLNKIY